MAVTATPSTSRLVLDYGEDNGTYSLTKLNPSAADEDLFAMAQNVAIFQEGSLTDVINHLEIMLENE
jgi:hypothetical protein